MAPIGTLDLAAARMLRHPVGLLLFLSAAGLGSGIHLIASASPILDDGAQAVTPWLRMLALGAASLAAWSIATHSPLRRGTTARAAHAENTLVIASTTLGFLAVGAGSLALAGFPLEPAFFLIAPLKLAALGALALSCAPNQAQWAVGLLWALPLAAPQLLPAPVAQLVSIPLDPALLPQSLSILGLLLLGQGLSHPATPATEPPEA